MDYCVIVEHGPSPATTSSAVQLAKEFGEAEDAATKKYTDKWLIVEGEIVKAVPVANQRSWIYLKGGKVPVACVSPPDLPKRIQSMFERLKTGQRIKGIGKYEGSSVAEEIQLVDFLIISKDQ